MPRLHRFSCAPAKAGEVKMVKVQNNEGLATHDAIDSRARCLPARGADRPCPLLRRTWQRRRTADLSPPAHLVLGTCADAATAVSRPGCDSSATSAAGSRFRVSAIPGLSSASPSWPKARARCG